MQRWTQVEGIYLQDISRAGISPISGCSVAGMAMLRISALESQNYYSAPSTSAGRYHNAAVLIFWCQPSEQQTGYLDGVLAVDGEWQARYTKVFEAVRLHEAESLKEQFETRLRWLRSSCAVSVG